MRIALFSDIHGNDIALQAVVDDINRQSVDRIVCLGDVATLGPRPTETLQILRDLKCPCILGNHDAFLLQPDLIHSYTEAPEVVEAVDWCRQQLHKRDVDFLETFIPTLQVALSDDATLLLYHGTPDSHMQEILSTTSEEQLDRHINGHCAEVMAGGHTHVQMLRQHKNVLILNPGSAGYPFLEFVSGQAPTILGHAEYAIVEALPDSSGNTAININLRRVNLDITALYARVSERPYPMQSMLMNQYRRILSP